MLASRLLASRLLPARFQLTGFQRLKQRPAGGDRPHVLVEQHQRVLKAVDHRLGVLERLDQSPLHRLDQRDAGEGHHHAFQTVVKGPVRADAHQVPLALLGLHLRLERLQRVDDVLQVAQQVGVAQPDVQVCQRAAPVGVGQRDDRADRRGEAPDVQIVAQEDDGGAHVFQQVAGVVAGLGLIPNDDQVLGVDRVQFLVERLQFLLGGGQFLVGALQLLVGGLQLLVAGAKFLHRDGHFLQCGLQGLAPTAEFQLQRRDLPGGSGSFCSRLTRSRLYLRAFPEHHQQRPGASLLSASRLEGLHTQVEPPWQFSSLRPHTLQPHAPQHDFPALRVGLMDGGLEPVSQVIGHHVEDPLRHLAGGQFQVTGGAAVHVQHLAVLVDHHGGRRMLGQQRALNLLGQVAQAGQGQAGRQQGRSEQGRVYHARLDRGRDGRQANASRQALKDLPARIERGELCTPETYRLAGPQKQQPHRPERVQKRAQQLLLQLRTDVDQHVAAAHQVQPGKRRVSKGAVGGKYHQVAHLGPHLILVVLERKIAAQAFGRDDVGDVLRIPGLAGHAHRRLVDVGGENLHPDGLLLVSFLDQLAQHDGHRVGLLAGGTGRHPDPEGVLALHMILKVAAELRLERLEGLCVPEEAGDVDGEILKQRLDLVWRVFQPSQVHRDVGDLLALHAPVDAANQRGPLVAREIVAGARPDQPQDALQRRARLAPDLVQLLFAQQPGLRAEPHQAGGEVLDRQHVVGHARASGAARHLGVFRRAGVLDQHPPAVRLDGPYPLGAVAAHARQHEGHGPFTLV